MRACVQPNGYGQHRLDAMGADRLSDGVPWNAPGCRNNATQCGDLSIQPRMREDAYDILYSAPALSRRSNRR